MSSPVRSGSQKANDTLGFLRSKISSGEWPIDELIPKEPELMELIGVGKSTVREAVRSLVPRVKDARAERRARRARKQPPQSWSPPTGVPVATGGGGWPAQWR